MIQSHLTDNDWVGEIYANFLCNRPVVWLGLGEISIIDIDQI